MTSFITQEQCHKYKKCSTPRPEIVVRAPPTRQKAQPSVYRAAGLMIPSVNLRSSGTKRWFCPGLGWECAFLPACGPGALWCLQARLPAHPLPSPFWNGAAGLMLLRWQGPDPCEPQNCWGHKSWAAGMNNPFLHLWLVIGLFSADIPKDFLTGLLLLSEWLTGKYTFSSPNHWRNWEHSYCTKSEKNSLLAFHSVVPWPDSLPTSF